MRGHGPTGAIGLALLISTVSGAAASTAQIEAERNAAAGTPRAEETARTGAGHSFIVPAGWRRTRQGSAEILEAPEEGSRIVLVDVAAETADGAVAGAWELYRGTQTPELIMSLPAADGNGWREVRNYTYRAAPEPPRFLTARAMRGGGGWAVRIEDMANAVAGKRSAELALIREEFLPRGYVRESFAGRTAHRLDPERIRALKTFLEESRVALGVPGLSVGIVQNGRIVLAEGFGVREAGKPERVDADTLYLVASNTKPLTTLLLAKLVDESRVSWETPVTEVMPQFRLADSDATRKVLIKHLLCACTGLPYRNLDWEFAPEGSGPNVAFDILSRMRPTTPFGLSYQYSNPIAAAGGYVGGRIAFPNLELGEAYDRAMATRVFGPLGMTRTTFDFDQAMTGNFARSHGILPTGELALVPLGRDRQIHAVRPTGGAWSNVHDLLAYVRMELRDGKLDDGTQYMSKQALHARRIAQISTSRQSWYGMGLETRLTAGTPAVFHGGRLYGHRGDTIWWPEHGVGAVILMNASTGNVLMEAFPRRLLEVLFDGQPEAASMVAAAAAAEREQRAQSLRSLRNPADPVHAAELATLYEHPHMGRIAVETAGGRTVFDFGTWQAPVASRLRSDGRPEFVLITASTPFPFVGGMSGSRRSLTIRDAQNEYVFLEAGPRE